jgi:hypothetical protein
LSTQAQIHDEIEHTGALDCVTEQTEKHAPAEVQSRVEGYAIRHPRTANALLVLFSCLFCVVISEIAFGIVNARNSGGFVQEWFSLNQIDPLFGFKGKPNTTTVDHGYLDGTLIYDATYKTNEHGRRITPAENMAQRDRFIALFGCSFTFGLCVEESETVGAYLATMAPEYMPYNFAYLGWGPGQTLLTLEQPIEQEISQKRGVGVYVFIPHQVQRVIGNTDVIDHWGAGFPHYYLDGDKLVREGTLAEAFKSRMRLHRILGMSQTLRFFRLDQFPKKRTDADFKLTARIIAESKAQFQKKWPGASFYVAIYPSLTGVRGRVGDRMKHFLGEYGVPCIDLDSPEFQKLIDTGKLYWAAHPTPEANAAVAKILVDKLKLTE